MTTSSKKSRMDCALLLNQSRRRMALLTMEIRAEYQPTPDNPYYSPNEARWRVDNLPRGVEVVRVGGIMFRALDYIKPIGEEQCEQ